MSAVLRVSTVGTFGDETFTKNRVMWSVDVEDQELFLDPDVHPFNIRTQASQEALCNELFEFCATHMELQFRSAIVWYARAVVTVPTHQATEFALDFIQGSQWYLDDFRPITS